MLPGADDQADAANFLSDDQSINSFVIPRSIALAPRAHCLDGFPRAPQRPRKQPNFFVLHRH
jgi:hypothetical protein